MTIINKKILVIDDDPDILEALRLMLEASGYHVSTSPKGEYVDQLTKETMPDLFLLDVLLSGSDGRDIAKKLKSNTCTEQIPIILISADPSVSRNFHICGADDFVAKPFDVDFLLQRIKDQFKN